MQEWQAGIHYQAVASTKYKTNQVIIKAILPYQAERAAAWSLLARMMEDGSDHIPSKAALEGILAQLYGASLSVGVQRKGHFLEFVMASQSVRPSLVQMPDLMPAWLNLMGQLWFEQESLALATPQSQARFEREQAFQLQRIKRMSDDKRRLVVQKLYQELYRETPANALANLGDVARVQALTLADLAKAHREICQEAQFYLVSNGDLTDSDLIKWLEGWSLKGRQADWDYGDNYLALDKPLSTDNLGQLIEEKVQGQQANLAMAFAFPPAKSLKERIILQVANGIFGYLPVSRLFTEIREKQSLAYAIHSGLDFHRSFALVRAGISPDKVGHVYEEVQAQLADLMASLEEGDYLEEVKLTLLSADVQSRDYQHLETDKMIAQDLYPDFDLSTDYFESVVRALKAEEVIACLGKWRLVGAYALVGGKDERTLS